ncbi:flagellar motor stator protein MotA [Legionella nagasakiensis]|uniref:flagellar motor stator protein MotA n=1 Tax=Legionella nagasakiensis TaxID=535290 RepID=UPI0010555D1D|nr:flagellar motor stator protein MotA [Legionella nagasakiensis]
MLVIVGYLIILFSVFGGFAMAGGHLYALLQPIELLMIGGAALGAFVAANNAKTIKTTFKAVFSTITSFHYSKTFYVQLLSLLYELVNKIKRDGVLSIEADIENYRESAIFSIYPLIQKEDQIMEFLCDYLRLIITGRVDVHQLENLMEQDIETFECEKEQPIHAINKVSDALPAFGIVAAVMGVVHTMGSVGIPPEELGERIAQAMVGTFLGVLLSYGFTAPLAALLEHKMKATLKILNAIEVVLLATVNQFAPTIAVEFGRKVIYSTDRPNGKELEDIIKDIKIKKSGPQNE